jgi:hypothetical protein
LSLVASAIQDLFDGDIANFVSQELTAFAGIWMVLEQQFNRLSPAEAAIVCWLAINREAVTLEELKTDILGSSVDLLDALHQLARRSLLEKSSQTYTLQTVVMEYVTQQLVKQACWELDHPLLVDHSTQQIFKEKLNFSSSSRVPCLLHSHALIKATAKDYVREAQVRLILKPIADQLSVHSIWAWLDALPRRIPSQPSYAAGNLLNLLCALNVSLRRRNFSYLSVQQAYLRDAQLQHVNFAQADLSRSVFAETFAGVLDVAVSPCGTTIATSSSDGKVYLWQVARGTLILAFQGHVGWCSSIAISPNEQLLATGAHDRTVKLWNAKTGEWLQTFEIHQAAIAAVAFSPNGRLLASASVDHTICFVEVETGDRVRILRGHQSAIRAIAFSPDGRTLSSSDASGIIHFWEVDSDGKCQQSAYEQRVDEMRNFAHSQDIDRGQNGLLDQSPCLTFAAPGGAIHAIAYHPTQPILASAGDDHLIRLWSLTTKECVATLSGHSAAIYAIAFSPDGQILASAGDDNGIKLWT